MTTASTPDHTVTGTDGQDSKKLLHTPAEAAAMLAVKESWLRRQAGLRTIPSTMLGKHLRFSENDLAAIVRDGHRAPRGAHASHPATRRRTTRRQASRSVY